MFGGGSVVLTIGKLGKTAAQLEYFDAQVAAGVEDYYAGRGESPGRWRGSGITALGLQAGDRVRRSGFLALMRGVSPVDDAVLRVMGQRSTVAGLDLTFSAPKSVSVLFAVADEDTSSALLDAHEGGLMRRWRIWSARRALPGGVATVWSGCAARGLSPPRIGIGCRGRGIRSCIRMWWWRT